MNKKVWLITGAGRGMGADIATAALSAGHAVVATGRHSDAVCKALGQATDSLTVALDVTSFAPQGVDPGLIRLALVVAALQRERHFLAADDRMNADIDLPQLSGQTVGEHLRFDDTDTGRGDLPLD